MAESHSKIRQIRIELDNLVKETFKNQDEGAAWLRRPHQMLEGETPLNCMRSSVGAQRVKDILVSIKYGGVV